MKILPVSLLAAGLSLPLQSQTLALSDGRYYTDETQTRLYTGSYTEYFDDGSLKMELHLKDGKPEGTYVVYHPNGKTAEVRAYYKGLFHGEWRVYDTDGNLLSAATYKDGKKDGPWRVWNGRGVLRFEMFYIRGRRTGVWRSWDDGGNLLSEETY
jgi:antitoxin component YwqK of YwqJK toxin-antitoxin module